MFLKCLREDEQFRVYSDNVSGRLRVRDEYLEEGMYAMQINSIDMLTFSGFCFIGTPEPWWAVCGLIYAVVSFKENPLEHIEGCFPQFSCNGINPYVLSLDDHWISTYIKNMKSDKFSDDEKKRIGWRHLRGDNDCEKFDVENDITPYYVRGNIRIKLDLTVLGERTHLDKVLVLAREQFAAQKIIKFSAKSPTDCDVRCDSWRSV